MVFRIPCAWFLLAIALAVGGCQRSDPPAGIVVEPRDLPKVLVGIHNVHRVDDRLFSGSSPEGDEGFESLASLGIKTIISVDGARPDVDRARKHGMRYVHLPVGYDGIPRERVLQLARVVRDMPGPVYLHCHHGKHRGPAAALSVRMCLDDRCTAEEAIAQMKHLGTDPRYEGLYAGPRSLVRPSKQELDAIPADFPELAKVSPTAQLMVEVDVCFDHIKAIRAAGWKTPANQPDLAPAHEALLLVEHYRELARLPDASQFSAEFRRLLAQAERNAESFEKSLRADKMTAEAAYLKVAQDCQHCHQSQRDRPKVAK